MHETTLLDYTERYVAPTSKAAYKAQKRLKFGIRHQYGIIIMALEENKAGLTRNELEAKTGIRINAVCGRVNELRAAGVVETKSDRPCSKSGNTAEVVQLVPGYEEMVELVE